MAFLAGTGVPFYAKQTISFLVLGIFYHDWLQVAEDTKMKVLYCLKSLLS